MKSRQKFLVDTKSTCFLCLKTDLSPSKGDNDEIIVHSILNVSRYLKLDFANFLNNLNLNQYSHRATELMIIACKDCESVLTKFDNLFYNLELISLKLNANVEAIYQLMTGGMSEGDRLEECQQLIVELMTGAVVEDLWKKMLQKCSNRVTTSFPKVKLERLSREEESSLAQAKINEDSEELISDNDAEVASNWSEDNNISSEEDDNMPLEEDDNISCEENKMDKDPLEIGNETDESPKKQNNNGRKQRCKNGSSDPYRKCKLCGKILTIGGLIIHMRTHTGEMPFKCPHCSQSFRAKCNLEKHTMCKHRPVVFANCRKGDDGQSIPDEQFEDSVALLFENHPASSDGGYECRYCKKAYTKNLRNDLEVHMIRVHLEKLKAQLRENIRVYRKPTAEKEEIPMHHRKCHVCRKVVLRRNYNRHLLLHAPEKPLQCPHCPQRFRLVDSLRRHKLMRHRPIVFASCKNSNVNSQDEFENGIKQLFNKFNQQEQQSDDTEESYSCYFCSRKPFKCRLLAERHMMERHFKELSCQLKQILQGGSPEGKANLSGDTSGLKRKHKKCKKANNDKYKEKVRLVKLNCDHCDKQFETKYQHRRHLVSHHRFELFKKYFPVGATSDQVHSVIKQVLRSEYRKADDKLSDFQCNFPKCKLKFIRGAHLEFHVLISHFDEVVAKLKDFCQDGICGLQSVEGGDVKSEPHVMEGQVEEEDEK